MLRGTIFSVMIPNHTHHTVCLHDDKDVPREYPHLQTSPAPSAHPMLNHTTLAVHTRHYLSGFTGKVQGKICS